MQWTFNSVNSAVWGVNYIAAGLPCSLHLTKKNLLKVFGGLLKIALGFKLHKKRFIYFARSISDDTLTLASFLLLLTCWLLHKDY